MKIRSLERWKNFDYNEYTFEEFLLLTQLPSDDRLCAIKINDKYIDMHMRIIRGAPIVFFYHGAVQRSKGVVAPVFSGLNAVDSSLSRVIFSDASLLESNELGLAWHAGNSNIKLQSLLPKIIEKIIKISDPTKVLFAGGSGGGFAALYYSSFFQNSIAVVANAQTNILDYHLGHVRRYANVAFRTTPETLGNYVNVDLKKVYSKKHKNKVFYMQNMHDKMHLKKHCFPFIRCLDNNFDISKEGVFNDGNIFFISPDWGIGHIGPDREFWREVISKLALYPGETDALFSSNEFKNFVDSNRNTYKERVLDKAKISFNKRKYETTDKFIDHYYRLPGKPKASFFSLAIDNSFKLNSFDKMDSFFLRGNELYPNGWVIKYKYAQYICEIGRKNKALDLFVQLRDKLKERSPKSLSYRIEKIKLDLL